LTGGVIHLSFKYCFRSIIGSISANLQRQKKLQIHETNTKMLCLLTNA
jgi:hypothetical protein